MNGKATKLKSLVARRMSAAGLDWANFEKQANQVVVFGSYALSANRRGSDLDVLCIGDGPRFKSTKLHVIWVSEPRTRSKAWLRSELATHVAVYGKWIKGRNTWAHVTTPSPSTIRRKKANILARLYVLRRYWNDLLPSFQGMQLTKLRRDIQRYQMMRHGHAPVPKTLLDKMWTRNDQARQWSALLGANSRLSRNVMKFLTERGVTNAMDLTIKHKDG